MSRYRLDSEGYPLATSLDTRFVCDGDAFLFGSDVFREYLYIAHDGTDFYLRWEA